MPDAFTVEVPLIVWAGRSLPDGPRRVTLVGFGEMGTTEAVRGMSGWDRDRQSDLATSDWSGRPSWEKQHPKDLSFGDDNVTAEAKRRVCRGAPCHTIGANDSGREFIFVKVTTQ